MSSAPIESVESDSVTHQHNHRALAAPASLPNGAERDYMQYAIAAGGRGVIMEWKACLSPESLN